MQRAKAQLFKPFRWSFWWRMAIIAFFAGEFSRSGFNVPNFNGLSGGGNGGQSSRHVFAPSPIETIREFWPLILLGALLLVVLIFVFMYLHSVFRFILFESVLRGQYRIRQSWRLHRTHGLRYFVWLIVYQLLMLLVFFVLLGLPLLGLWQAGIFTHAGEHIALLVFSVFLLVMVFLAVALIAWVITTIVRDFLVPVMALEDVSVGEAWHIYKTTLLQNKASVLAYLGMKIVLAIAVSIIVGIASLFFFLILLIPFGALFLAAVAFIATGKAGMVAGIFLALIAGLLLFVVLFCLYGILAVPAAVFFQSYALYYVGARYQRLGELLWPTPPASAPESGALPVSPAPA